MGEKSGLIIFNIRDRSVPYIYLFIKVIKIRPRPPRRISMQRDVQSTLALRPELPPRAPSRDAAQAYVPRALNNELSPALLAQPQAKPRGRAPRAAESLAHRI